MNVKSVPISVSLYDWTDFAEVIAQDAKKLLNEGKFKSLNLSNVSAILLEEYLKGNYKLEEIEEEDGNEKIMRAVVIDIKLWKKVKDHITKCEANGNKIKGGIGGLVVSLIKAYIKRKFVVF